MNKILSEATTDKMNIVLDNSNSTKDVLVALCPADYNVMGIEKVGEDNKLHYHNTENLVAEGYCVDTILDDATVDDGNGRKITMSSKDSNKTLRHILENLRRNPRFIKRITVKASDVRAFSATIQLGNISAFFKERLREVLLEDYFSVNQFQKDKIDITFDLTEGNRCQWNESLFMALSVPAGVLEFITVEFFNDNDVVAAGLE